MVFKEKSKSCVQTMWKEEFTDYFPLAGKADVQAHPGKLGLSSPNSYLEKETNSLP